VPQFSSPNPDCLSGKWNFAVFKKILQADFALKQLFRRALRVSLYFALGHKKMYF